MKIEKKPAISKLVARFDNELRNILMNDLKAMRQTKYQFLKAIKPSQLSVA
jgi:hypothetical protein